MKRIERIQVNQPGMGIKPQKRTKMKAGKPLPPAPTQKLKNRVLRQRARAQRLLERNFVRALFPHLDDYFARKGNAESE